MHKQLANSAALARAGVDRHFVPRNGIRVERDARTGDATGIVEEGFDLFDVPVPDIDWYTEALRQQVRESWVRHGVTTIHELPASATATAAWQRLDAAGAMPCRIILNPILAPGHQASVEAVEDYVRLGLQTGFGSEWLRFGALKLFLDGSGAAAWWESQLDETPGHWGLPPFSFNELVAILGACRRAGVQVWMHAVGGVAQWLGIDAVEAVNLTHGPSDHRTRIEHIGNAITDLRQLPRLLAAGITPVPTSAFMFFSDVAEPSDQFSAFPYETLLQAGLQPPGNSDSAGTQPFATNPWYGVWCMVARHDRKGKPIAPPSEALTVDAAVRTYTAYGARVGFEEDRKGVLAPGVLGDVAVYADDPFSLETDELRDLVADLTIVGGRVVHGEA